MFLGIDSDGSKCKARLANGTGKLLGEGVAGPANVFQEQLQARRSIVESAQRALASAHLPDTDIKKLVVGAGLAPETALSRALASQLAASGLGIVDAMVGASSRDYGALAPLVLECAQRGDPVALEIVREGAAYLSDMAEKLLGTSEGRLCLLGGLGERLQAWMRPEIVARVVPPLGQPDEGAMRFAIQCYDG